MRCVSERVTKEQLPDFISVEQLGRLIGLNALDTYRLVRRPDFPKIQVVRKYIINKEAALAWLEQQTVL